MKICYLCHDPIIGEEDGTISYTASADALDKLYACRRCVANLGLEEAFNSLEEHYEHRASMRSTLPTIKREDIYGKK
jgi:hypothetical protein